MSVHVATGMAQNTIPRLSYYMLGILALMNTLNYLDRQVINILAELIKEDLGLMDWQLGVLTGLAFAILYTGCAIPIARLAERVHRPTILGLSLGVWSAFTVVCGLAQNFGQLALARVGVGLGEAGGTPAAHSLIADGMPQSKRAFAMAVFSAGIPLGTLFGLVIGGIIADQYGWRAAFFVAGAPGLLLSLVVVLTIREPRGGGLRADLAGLSKPREDGTKFSDALREIFAKKSFVLIALGSATGGFVNYVHSAFYSAFLFRAHGEQLANLADQLFVATGVRLGPVGFLGLTMGLAAGLMGILGTLAGGWITDRAARNGMGAYMLVPGVSKLVAVPLAIVTLVATDLAIVIPFIGLVYFTRALSYAPGFSSVQGLVRPALRPTAAAVLFFTINLIGLGMGPLAVGILSDVISAAGWGPRDGLRIAMLCAESVGLLGALLYFRARRIYAREVIS